MQRVWGSIPHVPPLSLPKVGPTYGHSNQSQYNSSKGRASMYRGLQRARRYYHTMDFFYLPARQSPVEHGLTTITTCPSTLSKVRCGGVRRNRGRAVEGSQSLSSRWAAPFCRRPLTAAHFTSWQLVVHEVSALPVPTRVFSFFSFSASPPEKV